MISFPIMYTMFSLLNVIISRSSAIFFVYYIHYKLKRWHVFIVH